jgi:hypothetical protein
VGSFAGLGSQRAAECDWAYLIGVSDSPQTITSAQRGLSAEQVGRTRKYLISMGIRTACVIGAIFIPGWPRWVLIAGAVVLPYLAVVIANGGRERDDATPSHVTPLPQAALPASGKAIEGVVIVPADDTPPTSTVE